MLFTNYLKYTGFSGNTALISNTSTREGLPRIPCLHITQEENKLLIEMSEKLGSKKAALIKGLRLLKNGAKIKISVSRVGELLLFLLVSPHASGG